jgi:hypothetical protein
MGQAKYDVLSELAAIRKEIANLEVRLAHVVTILHKGQICKNEGLCRDVKNIELGVHEIGAALEKIIDKYFNVCDEIRKVYWSNFRGESLVAGAVEAYDNAEDYAWKQFGLSDISRCFKRKKRSE